jgi:hypothetical protein
VSTVGEPIDCSDAALTWPLLVAAEPYLGVLESQVRQLTGIPVPAAYHDVKVTLEGLVGWQRGRGPNSLRSEQAYELAAMHLARALECRRQRRTEQWEGPS